MRYGVIITGGEPAEQVDLARAAETAGWDGIFTWDGIHVGDDVHVFDPFAMLAAFAVATDRVTLGAIVQPLSRRRPWELARQTTTVDRLSHGRLVLPVGLGARDDRGFGAVGETEGRRAQAAKLDEVLIALDGLWSGEPYEHAGTYFAFPPMAFAPTPVQRPRIPIWVVGRWLSPRSMARALRWDGILPSAGHGRLTADAVAEARSWLAERRSLDGYDIVIEGVTPAEDPAAARAEVQPFREAGATWWIESNWSTWSVDDQRRRIEAGPPQEP
jgi:alkanesulfonate monooxygenase SsuD/methylene tetrahydromethanopterin reductase-like flavin-dependent oxidoreductase (luciferase family)